MQPFSTELLTILVLVCLSWVGLTYLAGLSIFIYWICSKRRPSKSIKPIRTPSTVSIDNHSSAISPIPIRNTDQHQKSEQKFHHYDANSMLDDHSYMNMKNKYQRQEYMRDENDETTTINESQMYVRHPHPKRSYQAVKPMTDVRIIDRHTPYPPDVIARERLMNNTRFPMENKY